MLDFVDWVSSAVNALPSFTLFLQYRFNAFRQNRREELLSQSGVC